MICGITSIDGNTTNIWTFIKYSKNSKDSLTLYNSKVVEIMTKMSFVTKFREGLVVVTVLAHIGQLCEATKKSWKSRIWPVWNSFLPLLVECTISISAFLGRLTGFGPSAMSIGAAELNELGSTSVESARSKVPRPWAVPRQHWKMNTFGHPEIWKYWIH